MSPSDLFTLAILILIPILCFFVFFCLLMVLYVRNKTYRVEKRIVERIIALDTRLNEISSNFDRIRHIEAKLVDISAIQSSQDERLGMLHTWIRRTPRHTKS